ncbi:hypothetical protein [Olleya sp. R77988]|uniref:hypothetical protein n=1 Tax=Olleya sp. R77988 TaxID=3093875 RepID=UPI0037C58A35
MKNNKIKTIVLFAFMAVVMLTTKAQNATFEWSDLSSNTKVGLQNPTLVFPTTSGFTTYSIEKQGTQVFAPESVFITKFNSNGDIGKTIDFALPKRALKDATLLKVIEGNNKLYVFSFIAVKKDQKNVLYCQVYDNTTGAVSDPNKIYVLPIEKVGKSGFFNIKLSEDQKTFALLVNKPFEKKTKEKIEVVILDANLNSISNSEHSLSFDSKRAYNEEMFVENDATVNIIKKTNIFSKSPITSILTIKEGQLSVQTASAEEFYISDNRVITIDAKQYLVGFATNNAKPAVSMGGAKDKSVFIYNITDQKLINNHSWDQNVTRSLVGKGFIDLKVKDLIILNNDIYLIGQCFTEVSRPIEGQSFQYNYTYTNGPGIMVRMNTKGGVGFAELLNKTEAFKNEAQRIASFKPVIMNDNLYFLGNERVSVLEEKKIVFGWKNINAKAIVSKKIHTNGTIETKAHKSGIVGGKDNVLDFAPTKTIQLDDKTFYIYAIGNKYQAFGKMTID